MSVAPSLNPSRARVLANSVTPVLFGIGVIVNVAGLIRQLEGTGPAQVFRTAFVAANLAWLIAEAPVTFRRPSTQPRELATLIAYGTVRMSLVAAAVLGPQPSRQPSVLPVAAGIIFASGVLLRLVAMRTLGDFYSHHVIRRADHLIVCKGPYRVLRHPAYAGMLAGHLGLVLLFFNWASAILLAALAVVLIWRIHVEERELLVLPVYQQYAAGRPRLIPGMW
jgi:protein-S-isoprenylcysteine O-methyltransferase Ste14